MYICFSQTFSKEVDEGFPHIFEELVRLCKDTIVEQCGLLENNCCNSAGRALGILFWGADISKDFQK